MDFEALVNEIVNRVAEKLSEAAQASTIVCDEKPRLLILTQEHGEYCHSVLESARLGEYYRTECALMQEYQCDASAYEAAILFGLTNEALGKLAGGTCDTPFTALAQKLILSGKKVFIPAEEVELYAYQQTAPAPYYAMMESKLQFLQQCGVTICKRDALEDVILNGAPCENTACTAPQSAAAQPSTQAGAQIAATLEAEAAPAPAPVAVETKAAPAPVQDTQPCASVQKEASIDKHIVTEKDMIAVCEPGVTAVHIRERAILTELAKDYTHQRRITVIRD